VSYPLFLLAFLRKKPDQTCVRIHQIDSIILFYETFIEEDPVCRFFKVWPWWPLRHFEKLQLFHLNTKVVIKRGFTVFWWCLCSEVLLYFERPLENVEKPFLKKHEGIRPSLLRGKEIPGSSRRWTQSWKPGSAYRIHTKCHALRLFMP